MLYVIIQLFGLMLNPFDVSVTLHAQGDRLRLTSPPPPPLCSQALEFSLEEAFSQLVIELFQDGTLSMEQVQALADVPSSFDEIIGSVNVRTTTAIRFLEEIRESHPSWKTISTLLTSFLDSTTSAAQNEEKDQASTALLPRLKEITHATPIGVKHGTPIYKVKWEDQRALLVTSPTEAKQDDDLLIVDPIKGDIMKRIQIPEFQNVLDLAETKRGHLLLISCYSEKFTTEHPQSYLILYHLESGRILQKKHVESHHQTFRFQVIDDQLIAYGHILGERRLTVIQIHEKEWEFQYIDLASNPYIQKREHLKTATFEYDGEFFLGFLAIKTQTSPQTYYLINLNRRKVVASAPNENVVRRPPLSVTLDSGEILSLTPTKGVYHYTAFNPFEPMNTHPIGNAYKIYNGIPSRVIHEDGSSALVWPSRRGGVVLLPLSRNIWNTVLSSQAEVSHNAPLKIATSGYLREQIESDNHFTAWIFEHLGKTFLILKSGFKLILVNPELSNNLDQCIEQILGVRHEFRPKTLIDNKDASYLVGTVAGAHTGTFFIKTYQVVGPLQ